LFEEFFLPIVFVGVIESSGDGDDSDGGVPHAHIKNAYRVALEPSVKIVIHHVLSFLQ
jgi:hypothetical protein